MHPRAAWAYGLLLPAAVVALLLAGAAAKLFGLAWFD